MGSRDKLGLLLGLVAIVLVVYVIKGLPITSAQKNNDTLVVDNQGVSLVIPQSDLMSDAMQAVDIIKQADQPVQIRQVAQNHEVRNVTDVPSGIPVGITSAIPSTAKTAVPATIPTGVVPIKTNAGVDIVHVVRAGETLGDIAKKVYGSVEGNKIVNIEKIFQANKDQLKSPDKVFEGQKLLIPPLSCLALNQNKTLAQKLIDKTRSMGFGVETLSSKVESQPTYRVQQGDTLWKIAAKQLGDGSRYKEIISLNKGVLGKTDDIQIGMELKMPKS